jgi:pimeloyl-ACP methyl ester carboxylesterase
MASTRSNLLTHKISLHDGRILGCLECGDPGGKPVFYFHGFPGSRLEVRFAHHTASQHKIRMIGIDRPGYGISDYKPNRTLLDWPDDIVQLADKLGIDGFSVLGVSGGGPYAAACACKIPHRLIAAGIVCGLGPTDAIGALDGMLWINRFGLRVAARMPWLIDIIMQPVAFLLRHKAEMVVSYLSNMSETADHMALKKPDIKAIMTATFKESMRGGSTGPARDVILYANPWGFDLADIPLRVHLWHGQKDAIVPVSMGRHMAGTIPNCRALFYDTEGHFSLLTSCMTDILSTFVV